MLEKTQAVTTREHSPPEWIKNLNRRSRSQTLLSVLSRQRARVLREKRRRWPNLTSRFPPISPESISVDASGASVTVQTNEDLTEGKQLALKECARSLAPWKKGPYRLFHLDIDAEWRSDKKWERLSGHLPPLEGKRVLDIGCNNGYFLFRASEYGPSLLLGIDPVALFMAQFELIQHYARRPYLFVEPLGVEHLPLMRESFEVCLCLGIIYHHRNPIQQLIDIRESLTPGGWLFLESIGIPGSKSHALFPEGGYARMGNVWFVPTLSCLVNWVQRARFVDVQVLADTPSSESEQRATGWCLPHQQSLRESLDSENPELTVEGYPAPRRFLLRARKRG